MRATPDDYAEARRLLSPVFEAILAPNCEATAADGLTAGGYHHDHDEELGMYWYNNPPANTRNVAGVTNALRDRSVVPLTKGFGRPRPRRARDEAYWAETGRVVLDYFELQAGALYSATLAEGFVAWLERSPDEQRRYDDGDDMTRAALVDWFLKVVR
jgi:hypothetical protein